MQWAQIIIKGDTILFMVFIGTFFLTIRFIIQPEKGSALDFDLKASQLAALLAFHFTEELNYFMLFCDLVALNIVIYTFLSGRRRSNA